MRKESGLSGGMQWLGASYSIWSNGREEADIYLRVVSRALLASSTPHSVAMSEVNGLLLKRGMLTASRAGGLRS